jgi:hypothetical protein
MQRPISNKNWQKIAFRGGYLLARSSYAFQTTNVLPKQQTDEKIGSFELFIAGFMLCDGNIFQPDQIRLWESSSLSFDFQNQIMK